MYWSNHDRKKIDKMINNALARKSRFYHRNVAVNGIFTNVKVVKVNPRSDILGGVGYLHQIESNIAYMLGYTRSFDTNGFNCVVDIVITNLNRKVVSCHESTKPNTKFPITKSVNVWIMAPGSINYLNIKIGDYLGTH